MPRPPFIASLRRLFAPPAAFAVAFARALRPVAHPPNTPQHDQAQQWHARAEALQAGTVRAAVDALPFAALLALPGKPPLLNTPLQQMLGLPANAPNAAEWPAGALCYTSGQPVPPGALPWARAASGQAAADWTPFLLAAPAQKARFVEVAAVPFASGTLACFRDTSKARRTEQQQARAHHTRHALADTARLFSRTAGIDALCQIAVDTAAALVPPDACALLCTFDGHGQPLVLRAAAPALPAKRPRRFADTLPPTFDFDAQSPLLWKVYVGREAAVSADIAVDPLFNAPRERALLHDPRAPTPVTSACMLPLLSGATATGHLLVTHPQPRAFDPDTQDTLSLLATLAAAALARARVEAARHLQADQLAALHEATVAAAALPETTDAPASSEHAAYADTLVRCAAAALGAAVCALHTIVPLPRADTDPTLHLLSVAPATALLPASPSQVPRCACARAPRLAVRRAEPAAVLAIPNPPLGECAWAAFGGHGTHSTLSVPLLLHGTTRGALTVLRHGSAPFAPHETALAETFAALATLALRA